MANDYHDDVGAVTYVYGTMNEEQRKRNRFGRIVTRTIRDQYSDIAPEPIREILYKWSNFIRENPGKSLCVRNAKIYFGYGDTNYRINPGSVFTNDGYFEYYSQRIIQDLEDVGCNYAYYEGFLD